MDLIVRRFIAASSRTADGKSQIVSLGSGLDTTFFRLQLDGRSPTTYFEVDFPEVTLRKVSYFTKHSCKLFPRFALNRVLISSPHPLGPARP